MQCGADSLANDRLGCFSLSLDGHSDAVAFMRTFGVPTLVTGGGGYTKVRVTSLLVLSASRMGGWRICMNCHEGFMGRALPGLPLEGWIAKAAGSARLRFAPLRRTPVPQTNVARCWAHETGVLVGKRVDEEIPQNAYYEYFGPQFKLRVPPPYVIQNANSRDYVDHVSVHEAILDS